MVLWSDQWLEPEDHTVTTDVSGLRLFAPVVSPSKRGCGYADPVAVAGSGRDLAFRGGSEVPTMSFIFSWMILNPLHNFPTLPEAN